MKADGSEIWLPLPQWTAVSRTRSSVEAPDAAVRGVACLRILSNAFTLAGAVFGSAIALTRKNDYRFFDPILDTRMLLSKHFRDQVIAGARVLHAA